MTLCGHTMAVTSVDWREMSSGHTLLATCSDDRVSYSCQMNIHNFMYLSVIVQYV